ncbi:tyrosine--tRNA ligase [candidate division WOR-3 bacterium]|nr:tyrosine--tRNA ligase [candidate division WOR-3 bacterium]
MEEFELLKKGSAEIIPEDEFKRKLKLKRPLRVKLGIDATGPDIHLGFAVVLRKLRQFQDFGHTAVLIVGDFTAMIGDPSGRSKTRPPLTERDIKKNMRKYKDQILRILREDRAEFRFNSEWLGKLTSRDIVKLTSKTTVARLLERDDFSKRFKENIPISMHELLYPIFQAYDSVMVNSDVELGGTDQKFNHLMGREIQKEFGFEPQVVFLMPILEGLDGVRKMSKSYNNYIGITESPDMMFGKLMSIPDALIMRYYELCTDLTEDELCKIREKLKDPKVNPRDIKLDLSEKIVSIYYTTAKAKEARENFIKVFSRREMPEKMPEYKMKKGEKIWVVRLLISAGFGKSNSEVMRVIRQGGLKINGKKVTDTNLELIAKDDIMIKFGKKKFLKVIAK